MGGCINKEKPVAAVETDAEDDGYDKLMKIVFVGDMNVGKSSIILRYTENVFTGIPVTSVGDNGQKSMLSSLFRKLLSYIFYYSKTS